MRFGRSFYCDGPKQKELLSYEREAELLNYARAKLPYSLVGISVICDQKQNYARLRSMCPGAAFCELNLKYSFRLRKQANAQFFETASSSFRLLMQEIAKFTEAFRGFPVLIKISRELSWMPGSRELEEFLDQLKQHGSAGIIIANSQKLKIPTFLSDGKEKELQNGVICGESLFDQTISLIEEFRQPCETRHIPIVATGGMIDPEQILLALRAGASAVQLCTAFEYYRLNYYNTLCWNLQNRVELRGLDSFADYLSRLRGESVASIYNMPFMYFERFWSSDIQRRITNDIRSSSRMDMFVMSGRSIVEEWKGTFQQRFRKNLGLRLLLPNSDGPTFVAIQKSWGISDGEIGARQTRVKDAKKLFAEIWSDAEDKRKQSLKGDEKEAKCEISSSDQCPFYSFYLFDDKVYIAPYPFVRPGKLESPVYVFFAGNPEFERVKREADLLFEYARQTEVSK
jgi:dihydroorotate dehydrogenase